MSCHLHKIASFRKKLEEKPDKVLSVYGLYGSQSKFDHVSWFYRQNIFKIHAKLYE